MRYCLIPNKNKIIENEKSFLEEKYKKGLKLKKKGFLFYHLSYVNSKEMMYEIDLLPNEMTRDELEVSGWETIETKRIFFKNLMKVYYLKESSEERFLVDDSLRFDFYKQKENIYGKGFMATGVVLGVLWALMLHGTLLSENALYVSVFLIALLTYLGRNHIAYKRGVEELRNKLGEVTLFHHYYVIEFFNLTLEQRQDIEKKLSSVGNSRKVKENLYRMDSPLSKSNLLEELLSMTQLAEKNISITCILDLFGK